MLFAWYGELFTNEGTYTRHFFVLRTCCLTAKKNKKNTAVGLNLIKVILAKGLTWLNRNRNAVSGMTFLFPKAY